VLERHFSPTIAIRMMFRTGSVDEVSGKTGLAHMFEHMMFKGTPTLGTKDYAKEKPLLQKIDELHQALDSERTLGAQTNQTRVAELLDQLRAVEAKEAPLVTENELWNLYEREGGSDLNASTSHDFTQYTVDLPSNKLELWALLDSDRVRNPVFRQFYQEREVVKEERRMRVDNNPDGRLFEQFLATSYLAHPYRNPTIGWEADLDHLSVSDLEDFYHHYYTPDRLTIAIVGDVQASRVISLVDKYFGGWEAHRAAPRFATEEPPASGTRRIIVRLEAQPHFLMGYHVPVYPDPDYAAVYALSQLLGTGTTSRLYKTLVEKKKIATAIDAEEDFPGQRYPSIFIISAAPRFPHTNAEIEKETLSEIAKVKTQPIEAWELEKMRAAVDVDLLNTLQTNGGMASTLAYDQAIFGDWHYLETFQKQLKELTPADLQKAAQKYLVPENLTVATRETVRK
jgi:predicted Zn-dependent peptidase